MYVASYVAQATCEARAVAERAESNKRMQYLSISRSHHLVPVAIETSGLSAIIPYNYSLTWVRDYENCHPRRKVLCLVNSPGSRTPMPS